MHGIGLNKSVVLQYQLLRVTFAYSFNKDYCNCITLFSHASNIAKFSKKINEPILDVELILLQQHFIAIFTFVPGV